MSRLVRRPRASGVTTQVGTWVAACWPWSRGYHTARSITWHSDAGAAGRQLRWCVGVGGGYVIVVREDYAFLRERPGWSSRTYPARRMWLPRPADTVANDMGFATRGHRTPLQRYRAIMLPLWCAPIAVLLPAVGALALHLQRARRAARGLCTVCGFHNVVPAGLVPWPADVCLQCGSDPTT